MPIHLSGNSKIGDRLLLFPLPHHTFQTFSVLFSLARKGTKRAYRGPRMLVPLGTTASVTALGVGSRGIYFIFILLKRKGHIRTYATISHQLDFIEEKNLTKYEKGNK